MDNVKHTKLIIFRVFRKVAILHTINDTNKTKPMNRNRMSPTKY